MSARNIVILGGGSGGAVAANQLGEAVGKDHNITVIDQRPQHHYQSSYLWMARGWREPQDISRDLTALERRHVRFLNDRVEHIDTNNRVVTTTTRDVPYDYLIVSLGLQSHPELIPGDNRLVHHSWEMDAALRLRTALKVFNSGRLVVGISSPPYRCPPGPYEATWLIEDGLVEREVRDNVSIDFFTSEPGPLGGSGQPSEFMREHLERRGVTLHTDFTIETVDGESKSVRSTDGRELPFDLLFIVPPHRPSQVLIDSGLTDGNGIEVDVDTLATRWENVYAIGDAANMPASKAGVVAHQEADVVAHNIAHELTGHGHPARLRLHTM
ncbi:MAG: NAD(P)/FAD-dependent oxidoreductase [Chloroflexota bacterium]